MSFSYLEEGKAYMYYFHCTAALSLTPSLLHGFSVSCTAMSSVALYFLLLLSSSQAHLSFPTPPCSLFFLCLTLPSYPKLANIPFPGFLFFSLEEAGADFPTLTLSACTVPLSCYSYHSRQAKAQAGTRHCPLSGIKD